MPLPMRGWKRTVNPPQVGEKGWRGERVQFTGGAVSGHSKVQDVMHCIYNRDAVFDWDQNNLRKIRAHRIKRADVEQALSNGPIPIYEQSVGGEPRFVYYGETDAGAAGGRLDRTR